jgi:hypothetical protein
MKNGAKAFRFFPSSSIFERRVEGEGGGKKKGISRAGENNAGRIFSPNQRRHPDGF